MSAIQRKVSKTSGSNPKKRKKLALGKGLDALIPDIESVEDRPLDYFFCEKDLISPNLYQTRLQVPEDVASYISIGLPKLGASLSLIFLGITDLKTLSLKCFLASSATW